MAGWEEGQFARARRDGEKGEGGVSHVAMMPSVYVKVSVAEEKPT